jgi:hypothetical protein
MSDLDTTRPGHILDPAAHIPFRPPASGRKSNVRFEPIVANAALRTEGCFAKDNSSAQHR